MTPAPEVTAAICGFSPRSIPAEAAAFAREVVTSACPPTKARAKALLFACSKLGAFGMAHGLECVPEVLLHPSVIERFCALGVPQVSPATRRTLRSNLRYVAARVLAAHASPAPLSRERAKAPYTDAEIARYLALCDAQPTIARRTHAWALVCLGAGAGLMGADLRDVTGADVVVRSGGVLVIVRGRRPRVVPVRAQFHERLLGSARFAGEGFLIGGSAPDRRNVTTPLVASLAGGKDMARLDTGRLRATWLSACAKELGIKAFMDAAGVVCTQRLGDIVVSLGPVDERVAVHLLGARG